MSNKNYSNKGFLTKVQELKRILLNSVYQQLTFHLLLFNSLKFLVSDSVREGMVSPHAHTGDTYSAYPWHHFCIVFGKQSSVVISISQSTKHHVTLFYYVVSSPVAPPSSMGVTVNKL